MPRTSGVVWFGMLMTEWKRCTWQGVPIIVSENGQIVACRYTSIRSNGVPYTHKARVVKIYDNKNGYLTCNINGKSMSLVHRVVCYAFHENTKSLPCVNHINGNKKDNRKDNLEWVTYKQNRDHASKVLGRRMYKSKLSDTDIAAIRNDDRRQREIALDYGVSQSTISQIQRGNTWISIKGRRKKRRLGEGSNVLSNEKIQEIRNSCEKGCVLAKRYGVSTATISRIINGRKKKCR